MNKKVEDEVSGRRELVQWLSFALVLLVFVGGVVLYVADLRTDYRTLRVEVDALKQEHTEFAGKLSSLDQGGSRSVASQLPLIQERQALMNSQLTDLGRKIEALSRAINDHLLVDKPGR